MRKSEIIRLVDQINREVEERRKLEFITEHGEAAWEEKEATKNDLVYEIDPEFAYD